jgi:hypothetical protein
MSLTKQALRALAPFAEPPHVDDAACRAARLRNDRSFNSPDLGYLAQGRPGPRRTPAPSAGHGHRGGEEEGASERGGRPSGMISPTDPTKSN